jgi:hypothetical protein
VQARESHGAGVGTEVTFLVGGLQKLMCSFAVFQQRLQKLKGGSPGVSQFGYAYLVYPCVRRLSVVFPHMRGPVIYPLHPCKH